MTFRSTVRARTLVWGVLSVAATLGLASVGYAFTWQCFTTDPARTAKTQSKHPPIADVRHRVLAQFHGNAANVFARVRGFGAERMPVVYRYVPFQTPEFSTSDVEVTQSRQPPELLKDVFALSLDGFREPAKAFTGSKGTRPMPPNSGLPGPVGDQFDKVVNGGLQLRLLDLVGLVDPDGARVYSGGAAFVKERLSFKEAMAARGKKPAGVGGPNGGIPPAPAELTSAKLPKDGAKFATRPLDIFEIVGVAELSQGKDLFVREKGQVIRMLGALRATEKCLKCHSDHKQGDLLGAFSYTFVDTNNTLVKDRKSGSAK